jgi:2-polyprenyl-3-methyl-5-hydroxy-6-metoxy-1,4-benzoquinol methylase
MKLRGLLATRGIHYLATRFGWQKLRSLAFDEKYRRGDWNFCTEGTGELADVVCRYLGEGDLLVMGCGGASILKDLPAPNLKSALGIDLSQEAIRLAGRFASEKISFQLADMVTFECPQPYDVILFSESLNYVPLAEQEPFLRRLGKSLKPNGEFIVTIAQAKRYADMLEGVRRHFAVLEDRSFSGSNRHLLVFNSRDRHA